MKKLVLVLLMATVMGLGVLAQDATLTPEPPLEGTPMDMTTTPMQEGTPMQATPMDLTPMQEMTVTPGAEPIPPVDVTEELEGAPLEGGEGDDAVGDATPDVEAPVVDDPELGIGDIVGDLETYQGTEVTFEGGLVEVVDEMAFYVESGGVFNRDRILVIYNNQMVGDFTTVRLADSNQPVIVTGTVQAFAFDQIEAENGVDFDPVMEEDLRGDYEGRAVVIADNVVLAEGAEPAEFDTIGDINDRTITYYNMPVRVRGDLANYAGQGAYILEQGNLFETNRILVVYPNGEDLTAWVEEGRNVEVSGTIRPFVPDTIESEYGVTLDTEVLTDYQEGNAVLVADSVTLVEEDGE
ncbi:MAG: hypothetical protein OHK0046_49700 [Anaerolineae bacterium]